MIEDIDENANIWSKLKILRPKVLIPKTAESVYSIKLMLLSINLMIGCFVASSSVSDETVNMSDSSSAAPDYNKHNKVLTRLT